LRDEGAELPRIERYRDELTTTTSPTSRVARAGLGGNAFAISRAALVDCAEPTTCAFEVINFARVVGCMFGEFPGRFAVALRQGSAL
jgi:hypothetical protein